MTPRMDAKQAESLHELMEAVLTLRTAEECEAFLRDLCTVQELASMAQRLQVAKRLNAGETYDAIRQQIPVSRSTITRINAALQFGTGGYQTVLRRLGGETGE